MAAKFEDALKASIEQGTAAGAAAIAVDKTGKVIYSNAFGHRDIEKKANDFSIDTTSWMASMTKLLTAVCVMQLVERGELSLDEPVSSVLSEFKSCTILTAMDDTTPITTPSPRCPTLRELLTHSSGLGYGAMHPLLTAYWTKHLNRAPDVSNNNILHQHSLPLIYAPGTAWQYGSGTDWAGLMVERKTSQRLEAYMQQHIFTPLDMPLSTFHPTRSPAFMAKMATRPMRDPATGKLTKDVTGMYPVIDPDDDFGGAGLYSSADQYVKVLTSLLTNDGRLLKAASRDELLRPCLSAEAADALNEIQAGPFAAFLAPGYENSGAPKGAAGQGVRYDWAMAGGVVVNEGGIGGVAEQGMVYWSGLPNCNWFIDQARGVAGVYVSLLMPPGDKPSQELYRLWHEAVYEMAG